MLNIMARKKNHTHPSDPEKLVCKNYRVGNKAGGCGEIRTPTIEAAIIKSVLQFSQYANTPPQT
jgi:hypothetical protein